MEEAILVHFCPSATAGKAVGIYSQHTSTGTGCPFITWWTNTPFVGKSIGKDLERKSILVFAREFLLQ